MAQHKHTQVVDFSNPNADKIKSATTSKMAEQTKLKLFTREQVVKIIDEILLNADCLMDAITNEYTDYDGEELLSMVENKPEIVELHKIKF